MENSISQKFTFTSLVKYTIPSIVMLVFMSLYTIIDGMFVSRFVNTDALSAVNIVYPFINVVIGVGVMLATGSSAVIATKMGENKSQEAKENFTLILAIGLSIGIMISVLGFLFYDDILIFMGANEALYQYCKDYFITLLFFVPVFITNLLYQYLTMTAGKPNVGLLLTVIGGCTNVVLDYLFIVTFDMGIAGAAYATGLGNLIPSIIATVYFIKVKGSLYFVKPKMDLSMILNSCSNGSSEMVTNLSTGVTTMLFNLAMMKYLGNDGVAAITIVLYGQFLIISAYIGFSSGVAPIISYNHGNQDEKEVRKIIGYSFKFIGISSIILFIIGFFGSEYIVGLFADKGSNVFNIGYEGFRIFSISFLIMGVNIFSSAMFTAFSNGKVSATISFLRTFVFLVIGILLFPELIGVIGVWIAVPVAEFLSSGISFIFINKYKSIYKYGKQTNSYNENNLIED